MQKIKVFFYNNKSWLYTLQYIFFSIILLLFVVSVDLRILPINSYIPDIIKFRVDFSQSLLISLSAAFLTITTFTFSTILSVLNTYAGSYTPRVVENFINMKITLKVIGIFMGGFFYCVGSMIFTREIVEGEHLISGFIAILYSIISIFYFIVFVQKVISKFQGVNIILDVAETAQSVIEAEIELRQMVLVFKKANYSSLEVKSTASGYLGVVDLNALSELFKEVSGYLRIDRKIGEYIAEGTVIATLVTKEAKNEDMADKILSAFVLQDKKIDTTDYRYNLEKLFERELTVFE